MHPSIERPYARGFIPAAGLALAMFMGGCGREREQGEEQQPSGAIAGASVCQPPGGPVAAQSRADLVAWASGVNYRPADPARAYVYGFSPGDSAVIQAAETTSGASCVVARLTSEIAYPARGIGAGANYVVIDSGSTGYTAMMVSADTSVDSQTFPAVMHVHQEGGQPPPTIGLMGGCVADCGSGTVKRWCRWALTSADSVQGVD
jgi:hypothetical protein